MTTATDRLEHRYRQLLRCYPKGWRRRHEDEMITVLLDQAEADGRGSVTIRTALDLIGHGAEERLDSLLRWLPTRLRDQVAVVALVLAAGLSLVMLVGEIIGAQLRPPPEDIHVYGLYFLSGPFLTIGVGLYLAFLTAALLAVLGRGGLARLLALAGVGYALWMPWSFGAGGYPGPQPVILVLMAGLGVLAALATTRVNRWTSRRMVGYGAGFVAAVAAVLLLTKPLLGWSVGTMTTSGNVALAALATNLALVLGAAIVISAVTSRQPEEWPAAIAVAALPVVLFCTGVSQSVNPAHAGPRALIPLGYVLVVAAVAAAHHRGDRRSVASG